MLNCFQNLPNSDLILYLYLRCLFFFFFLTMYSQYFLTCLRLFHGSETPGSPFSMLKLLQFSFNCKSLQAVHYCYPLFNLLNLYLSESWKDCFMLYLASQRPERRDYHHNMYAGHSPESSLNCSFLITRAAALFPSGVCSY